MFVWIINQYSSTSTTGWCYLNFLTSTHGFCQQDLSFLMYIPQRTSPHQSWWCDNEWFAPWPLSLLGCLHVCLTNFLYECNLIFHYQAVTWCLLPGLGNLQHQSDSIPTEPDSFNNSCYFCDNIYATKSYANYLSTQIAWTFTYSRIIHLYLYLSSKVKEYE